jgi:DNA-binding NarL/FixJ family response regulator
MKKCAVVADNESKVRFALRTLLVQRAQMDIVGEATCAEELLALVEGACPDLVLLHWRLQGMVACELLPRLKEICPDLRVIVLSARSEAQQEALASGADGFVSKMDHPEKLLAALGSVQQAPAPEPAQDGGVVAEDRRPPALAGGAPSRPPSDRGREDGMAVDAAGALAPAISDK